MVVSLGSRLVMQVLNRVEVVHRDRFEDARRLQHPGQGLLTFSNHVGIFDDPWILACFVGPQWSQLRWISADAHNFFGTPLRAAISSMGRAVPVVRGAGVDQPGMDFLAERLRAGEWVHVFPEGGRSREPDARLRRPLKTGLAHLVQRARPVLLGFYHRGMHEVMPIGSRIPRVGRHLTVRFSTARASDDGLADAGVEAIMAWVEAQLLELEAQALTPAAAAAQDAMT